MELTAHEPTPEAAHRRAARPVGRFTASERATAVELATAGWTVERVADHIRRRLQAVRRILAEEGIDPRPVRVDVDVTALIIDYWDHGLRACATKHRIARRRVRALLDDAGVAIRPRGTHLPSTN